MKKIISLINVFIKEYYQSLPIFDKSKNKFNKRSIFFWLIAIIFFGVSYLSYEIIKFLQDIGQKEIFINLYSPILLGILAFETILSCANIFFFSKDIKNVLHMPIKPTELLIAKLCTLLFMLYCTECIIAVVPLSIYGLMTSANFLYYFWAILILIVFPLFIATIISILFFIIMRFSKFIRNKEAFQILLTIILMVVIFLAEFFAINQLFKVETNEQATEQIINFNDKIENINSTFLIVNPAVKILTNPASIDAIILFLKIIFYNLFLLIIFLLIGNITYLKDILNNIISSRKS